MLRIYKKAAQTNTHPMNRREYLQFLAAAACLSGTSCVFGNQTAESPSQSGIPLTPKEKIMEQVAKHRPSQGGTIPSDLKHKLGATHVAGKYHLTNEPFLIEGAKKLLEFGSNICKLWFDVASTKTSYSFCSDWSALSPQYRLTDLAKHPYYEEVFDLPFSTPLCLAANHRVK